MTRSGSFLVEHYQPGVELAELRRRIVRVRAAAAAMRAEGKPVLFVRSTIVPRDEALLCVFDAASEQLVREAYTRAGVPFERISAAISEEGEG